MSLYAHHVIIDMQRSLEVAGNPEAQFMVGLFYATGLGGVKEDQGKVRLNVFTHEMMLISGITILHLCRATGISTCRDGFGIQALGGNKCPGG